MKIGPLVYDQSSQHGLFHMWNSGNIVPVFQDGYYPVNGVVFRRDNDGPNYIRVQRPLLDDGTDTTITIYGFLLDESVPNLTPGGDPVGDFYELWSLFKLGIIKFHHLVEGD